MARDRLNQLEGHDVRELRTNQELADEHSGKVLDLEAGHIRRDLLERMNREKGVISDDEKTDWQKKVDDSVHDISRLRSTKEDFEEHWRRSVELRRRFEGKIGSAHKEGILHEGEQEKLFETFTQNGLEAKQKAIDELDKELESRHRELKKFLKLEKAVQQKRRETLEGADNYDEKLKILESAEKENESYQKYREIFKNHSDKIGKQTTSEYLEWFLTLSENEQKSALSKAEKDDITPRVELFDIHASLPKEYQTPDFKEWGMARREQYLGEVERTLERNHRKLLREKAQGVFCKESIALCEKAFNDNEKDLGKRLTHKVMFLEALPGQIKAEQKLWDQFEKFDPEIRDILEEKFGESDFDHKQQILKNDAPKLADAYGKLLNKMNNKLDAHISESIRDKFEQAKTINEKAEVVKEGEAFQKSKDRYFAKWRKNAEAFRSEISVYEKWYAENVNSLPAAQKAEADLDNMIMSRQKIHKAAEKLPPNLKKRLDSDQAVADREKSVTKLQEIAKYYESAIPFLLQNAEAAVQKDDLGLALNFYMQALKMDPENTELHTLVAALRQKGVSPSLTPTSEADAAQTEALLEQADNAPDITAEAEDLARKQILFDLSKKHQEQSGTSGSATQARAQRSIRNLDQEDQDTAETILDEHGDTHTIDEQGTIRRKKQIKLHGAQTKETEEQLGQFFDTKQHKGEVAKSGLSEVAFKDDSGREVELKTAETEFQAQTAKLAERRQNRFLSLAQTKAGLTEQQMKAVKEAYEKAHEEDELVQKRQNLLAA